MKCKRFTLFVVVVWVLLGGFFLPAPVIGLGTQIPQAWADTSDRAEIEYVGSGKCKMCHLPQHREFSVFLVDTSRIQLRDQVTTDSKVLGHAVCHCGLDNQTDLCSKSRVSTSCVVCSCTDSCSTLQISYTRAELQCESCHGPGARHVALGMSNRDSEARRTTINLSRDGCRACHSVYLIRN